MSNGLVEEANAKDNDANTTRLVNFVSERMAG